MASGFYTNIRNLAVGSGQHVWPDFDTDTLKASLIDEGAGGVLDLTNDQDYDDISAGILAVGGTATLTSVTAGSVTGIGIGVVDCDPITWTTPSAVSAEYIVVYCVHGGATNVDPLIVAFDHEDTSGLAVTPTGGDVTAIVPTAGLFSF